MGREVRSAYMDIVERRALDDDRYQVTIAANESVRTQPDLDFGGLSTEGYARNPVVMWAHDVVGRSPSGGLPIGRTLELGRARGGGIVAEFEFLSDDPFAQRVRNAWDKGFLQAASISWLPLESVPVKGGKLRDTRSELLEWSIVAVPADPDALKESHGRMIDEYLGKSAASIRETGGRESSRDAGEPRQAGRDAPARSGPVPEDRGGPELDEVGAAVAGALASLRSGTSDDVREQTTGGGRV